MAYLITKDYQRIIQTKELDAITGSDITVRKTVESSVEAEIRSYLIQKYDLGTEFSSTDIFSLVETYGARKRIYLDADAYNPAITYALLTLTLHSGNVYRCSTAIVVPEAFNIAHWTLVGVQNDLYYVTLPYGLFDQDKFYKKGDRIWWNDKIFEALRDSIVETHEEDLQVLSIENIRTGNIFPDEGTNASLGMWGTGVGFSFVKLSPAAVPTDFTAWDSVTNYTIDNRVNYNNQIWQAVADNLNKVPGADITNWEHIAWTKGDNRNQYFVQCYMHMVVYELCSRIAPNNVPEARHNNWLRVIEELKSFANGNTTAELPLLQPKQGATIRFGGKVRQENNW